MAVKTTSVKYSIYKASFPNGKVYIGVTGQSLDERIRQHYWYKKQKLKQPMYRAIVKYKEQVSWEVLEITNEKDKAIELEISYIKKYKSNNNKNGYNLTTGGDGCFGLKRYDQRMKIIDNSGNIFLGYEQACEYYGFTESLISGSVRLGLYASNCVYFSKYEEGMTKALPRKFNRTHRKILDETNGICFLTLKDASEYHNLTGKSIQRVCAKVRNTVNNIKFSYLEY